MIPISRATLIVAGFSGALALAHAGCGSDDNPQVLDGSAGAGKDGGSSVMSLGDASTAPDVPAVRLSDSAAAGVMAEANTAEIMAGGVATKQAQNAAVKAFAQQMVTDHSMSSQRLMALMPKLGPGDGDSSVRQMLSTITNVALTRIATSSKDAFDDTYASTRVEMHRLVLKLLDEVLIPSAQNAELKAELTATRTAEMMHLTAAQSLLASGADGGS